ncbi:MULTISPECIES: DUF397 domain-containing protein [unclassified Streptomyces]|uniref:DUF397 domain-containing protein n=1 Tax=unclassified Streptomyces TaxID=2593676 RepID=UPI00225B6938|nr:MULTISPECIES: DUF397 domain-containing protein [unclassified Streptomyces]MCX5142662.1 DUF397 domain-containing protein [Streptomyces sp. NBC_00338]WRZ67101.1 DUF397 domain-containing protein [Streptomyces sp. NBC_01257]
MIRRTSVQGAFELTWFKSSYSSNGNEGDCVEVAAAPGSVHVRDSKTPQGPRLAIGRAAWADFTSYASES